MSQDLWHDERWFSAPTKALISNEFISSEKFELFYEIFTENLWLCKETSRIFWSAAY